MTRRAASHPGAATQVWLSRVRAAFRLTRVGLHLAGGMATVATVYPWISSRDRRALKRRWSRQLLVTLGIHLKLGAGGTAPPTHGLLVCNHVSWLDIFVINALAPAAFVGKDEIAHWPLIGWLCRRTETLFIARGSRAAAQRAREHLAARLRTAGPVAVFPEGTTTDGQTVLPFHAALFQGAIDAQAPVIPLVLRYVDRHGAPSHAPVYAGDITLWQCLLALAHADGVTADLRVLETIETRQIERRELSLRAHATIVWHLGRHQLEADPRPETESLPATTRSIVS